MPGGEIRLVGLTKRFGDVTAVDGIDLLVDRGEFFSLLGPSGCGKTTTLRMVAGFEEPTAGQILLDGADVARLPANKRNVNTVFQNYALFPFLSVQDNVAFGLRYTSASKAEVKQRVGRALELVQLTGREKSRPGQLSGGQQQRVALARALVLNPAVLLLDEPLGALDAKLRRALQVELKSLQERVGITFLYVTHDQEEALTMSDRLAVMSQGHIAQVGTPEDVYEQPVNAYVADFLGISNLMDALVLGRTPQGQCRLRLGEFELAAGCGVLDASGTVKLAIRPERVRLTAFDQPVEGNSLPAMIERSVFLGLATQVIVRLAPGERLQALVPHQDGKAAYEQGTPVRAVLPCEALRVLPADGAPAADDDPGVTAAPRARVAANAGLL